MTNTTVSNALHIAKNLILARREFLTGRIDGNQAEMDKLDRQRYFYFVNHARDQAELADLDKAFAEVSEGLGVQTSSD